MCSEPSLAVGDLVQAFRDVGLDTGDSLIVHSSFRSFGGRVEGGPNTVIEALLATIGPTGNLMLPTFNYTRPEPEPYFDPAATPGRTGVIPEMGRQRPDAVRSLQPTHSVAVIGPDAEALTRDHLSFRAFGVGSPVDRLARTGGKILMIGVGNVSNSTIHVAEEHAGVPKGSWYEGLPLAKVLTPDGTVIEHRIDTSSSCSLGFDAVDPLLQRRGWRRTGQAGAAQLLLMRGADVIRAVCDLVREKPDALLCTRPNCKPCTETRTILRQRGALP